MSISSLQASVRAAQTKLERLRKRDAEDQKKTSRLGADAFKLEDRAAKSSSPSLAKSHLNSAARKRKERASLDEKIAKRKREISDTESKLFKDEQRLRDEEEKERKRAAAKSKQQEARREQQLSRERRAREERESAQDSEISELHSKTTELQERLADQERANAPAEVSVLFVAATPDDQHELKISREVREIQKRVRMSDHRDSINFEWALARRITDLIQDLNETDPHILHFSGHGAEASLCLEDNNGNSELLTNGQLDRLLEASANQIRLVLFNSCDSLQQAKNAVAQIGMAIGMNASISDDSAKVFSAQFYNSLGFGTSVQQAFDQATLQLELELGKDHDVPQLITKEGVDPNTVVLVNPKAAD